MAVKDMNHLQEVLAMAKKDSKLLVLELMGSVNYTTTCEFMRPILDGKIVPAFGGSAYFYKLDVDNHEFKGFKTKWKVQALPDFVMVKNGKQVNRLVTTDKDELMTAINAAFEP